MSKSSYFSLLCAINLHREAVSRLDLEKSWVAKTVKLFAHAFPVLYLLTLPLTHAPTNVLVAEEPGLALAVLV